MTTREQIIAAACQVGFDIDSPDEYHGLSEVIDSGNRWITSRMEELYSIAFEAGRVAEREETNRRPLPDNTAPYIRALEPK